MVFRYRLHTFRSVGVLYNVSHRLLWRSRCLEIPRKQCQFLTRHATSSSKVSRSVPERLLIYHAGTGKTVFIGCLKLTTIFMFSFSCLFIAPALYTAAGQPNWMVAGSVIGGAVPMLFVAYTTSPFVTYIHLRIPQFARHSKDTLMKYSKKVPSDAELVMTTIQFSGRPRTTNMRLSELRSVDRRFGVVNLVRNVSKGTTRPRKLRWLGNGVTQFYVGSGINRVKDDSVLQNVLSTIKKKYV